METIISAVVTAVITGGLTLCGVLVSNSKAQAITETRIQERLAELTREVREHNGFAKRMPVVEQRIESLEKRIDRMESDNR